MSGAKASHVAIAEPVDEEFAADDDSQQGRLLGTDRPKGAIRTTPTDRPPGAAKQHAIES